ncbi:hypothetical protein AQUCO_01400846v1 [Aquilegia coerulea]|uniref:Protein POLYCHOME n=1 Tax=Aquilegia coerulea TaxID=218851 RepID=A0A2G5DYD2_AQUCA|nr:hypothetical protein AQUCO_01400846v1 [Aquilegia coerulea]
MAESRDRLLREEPLTMIFPRRSMLGVENNQEERGFRSVIPSGRIQYAASPWVMSVNRDSTRRRSRSRVERRGRNSSVLPSWYPRRPLGDITAVVDAIERRRSRLREANRQQNATPLQLVSTPRAPLEHSFSLVTPKPVAKILSDEGDSDFRTPQQKLLDSIEHVEKIMKEEIKRMQSTPAAKRAERAKKVRVVMSMR